MNILKVSIRQFPGNEDLPLPRYMTASSAGMDLLAAVVEPVTILPGRYLKVPTGIAIALPNGFEAQIRPRSGLAAKFGVTLVNAPGTIDADYRGEIAVIMINHGQEPFIVQRGDRIAQMIVAPIIQVEWDPQNDLEETERGEGGFGHTGVR